MPFYWVTNKRKDKGTRFSIINNIYSTMAYWQQQQGSYINVTQGLNQYKGGKVFIIMKNTEQWSFKECFHNSHYY